MLLQFPLCPFGVPNTKLNTLNMQASRNSIGMLDKVMPGCQILRKERRIVVFQGSSKFVKTECGLVAPGAQSGSEGKVPPKVLRDKKLVPDVDSPSIEAVNRLCHFFDQSTKLMVLTGAGISTECGIPDYRSPNGAYSSGYRPITHQQFLRSSQVRQQYWARCYAGWRQFTAVQPGPAHIALASLEKAGQIDFMVTQNVDRLHHRAGSDPLELHGTLYSVVCLDCGFSFSWDLFQNQVKVLNPKWAAAVESLEYPPGSDKSFGMMQRPDGGLEIDKFWEEDFHIPTCPKCKGVVKPDVVLFGDNLPKDRANRAMEAAKECDAFLVLGSSLMTTSAYRLVRAAHEAGAATAIVNIGATRADNFVALKIKARLGEILPRVLLDTGILDLSSFVLLSDDIIEWNKMCIFIEYKDLIALQHTPLCDHLKPARSIPLTFRGLSPSCA